MEEIVTTGRGRLGAEDSGGADPTAVLIERQCGLAA